MHPHFIQRHVLRVRPLAACLAAALALGVSTASIAAPLPYALPWAGRPAFIGGQPSSASAIGQGQTASHAALALDFARRPAATTIAVTNCADSGGGSLRAAFGVAVDGDTINLTGLPCSTITLETGELYTAANNLTLNGPGAGALSILSSYGDRVFEHGGSGALTIKNLTIAGVGQNLGFYDGPDPSAGGCIYSAGNVGVYDSVVTGCNLFPFFDSGKIARGGAIFARGNVSVKYSTISNNYLRGNNAHAYGGGVFALGNLNTKYATISGNRVFGACCGVNSGRGGGAVVGGNATLRNTTIADNQADITGGIELFGFNSGNASIINSTISGNTATIVGGILTHAPLTLQNSTVAFNRASSRTLYSATYDAGLHIAGVVTQLQSSIIANNTVAGVTHDISKYGSAADASNGANCLITASDVVPPADTIFTDPLLYPLANNGGLTRTHALAVGSPAINAGNNNGNGGAGYSYDQRGPGFARVIGANADIGAFEKQNALDGDVIFINGFDPP